MDPVIAIALIGEVLAWVGVLCGVVPLLLGILIAIIDGRRDPVEVVVDESGRATWTVGTRRFSRDLRDNELVHVTDDPVQHAFVSRVDPASLYWDAHRPAGRVLLAVGAVLVGAGAVGFVLSLLPLLV